MQNGENIPVVIGFNHKTSTVHQREKLQLSRKEIPEALKKLFADSCIEGILVITTCNRLEFYFSVPLGTNVFDKLAVFYLDTKGINLNNYSEIFFILENSEATRHLFKVISGIDSLIIGEYQIQGQVKEAYSIACQQKTVDKILHKLLHAAFRTGKSVRSATPLGSGKQSIAGAASNILLGKISCKSTITIIGVNENTHIIAEALKSNDYDNLIFVNRTLYKAETMANDFGGRAMPLADVLNALYESDAVFSCTGASDFIIGRNKLNELAAQGCCPGLIIDMAVPRDIDSSGLPENIEFFDIDSLQAVLARRQQELMEYIPDAELIIEDEVSLFKVWTESQSDQYLGPYAEKFEQIRLQLLNEYRDQFSSQSFEKVDRLTRSLVHRMQSTFVKMIIKSQANKEKL